MRPVLQGQEQEDDLPELLLSLSAMTERVRVRGSRRRSERSASRRELISPDISRRAEAALSRLVSVCLEL